MPTYHWRILFLPIQIPRMKSPQKPRSFYSSCFNRPGLLPWRNEGPWKEKRSFCMVVALVPLAVSEMEKKMAKFRTLKDLRHCNQHSYLITKRKKQAKQPLHVVFVSLVTLLIKALLKRDPISVLLMITFGLSFELRMRL